MSQYASMIFKVLTRISFLPNAREIYYRDPELFQNQNVVNRYVDDLAFSFGVRRASLNVVGSFLDC